MIVTIDGPSGSGKSIITKTCAKRLGFYAIDTGLLYRLATYEWLLHKTRDWSFINSVTINEDASLNCFGQDFTIEKLDDTIIEDNVPIIAQDILLRSTITRHVRSFANDKCCVVNGRDAGTVIFPDADIKVYLYLSPQDRLSNMRKLVSNSTTLKDLDDVIDRLNRRDYIDRTRSIASLTVPKDAIAFDMGRRNWKDVVNEICELVLSE